MSFWHGIGQQLKQPEGIKGRVIGRAMRLANSKPNAAAIEALSIQPTDHILELGFGPGQAIARMARLAPLGKIVGIDASLTMLVQALQYNKKAVAEGRVELQNGQFSPLPMADASIDKILAVNVVYFWVDTVSILAECYRVLRPGGKIAIYATDAASMRRWKFADSSTHILYTADDLLTALQGGGFMIEDTTLQTFAISPGIRGIVAVGQKASLSSHH